MKSEPQFVVCIKNKDYAAALELRKLYQLVKDETAAQVQQIRVIDESGEDYLYPENYFVPVELPQSAEKAVLRAADAGDQTRASATSNFQKAAPQFRNQSLQPVVLGRLPGFLLGILVVS